MFVATKDMPLATTVRGSLPRPSWYTANLEGRAFSLRWPTAPIASNIWIR